MKIWEFKEFMGNYIKIRMLPRTQTGKEKKTKQDKQYGK